MPPSCPLGDIDIIDWGSLNHAYGGANDIPDLLRELRSSNANRRRAAYRELYSCILHQGSRYTATSAVVPFLYRLLGDPETPDRDELLTLIADLGIGPSNGERVLGEFLISWLKTQDEMKDPEWPAKERQRRAAWVAAATDQDERRAREVDAACDTPPEVVVLESVESKCYEAVQSGLSYVFHCLSDDSAAVRAAAAYALAWFPQKLAKVHEALFALLESEENSPVRAAALVSLAISQAIAGDYSETEAVRVLREAYSQDDADEFVKWASGMALVRLRANTPEQLSCVVRGLMDEAFLSPYVPKTPDGIPFLFAYNTISTLFALTALDIEQFKGSEHPEVIRGLISRFPSSDPWSLFELSEMALYAAFDGVKPGNLLDFRALTPIQRELVEAFANVSEDVFHFFTFYSVLATWGLPNEKAKLQQFVAGSPDSVDTQ